MAVLAMEAVASVRVLDWLDGVERGVEAVGGSAAVEAGGRVPAASA
jgi:hypothetical protein